MRLALVLSCLICLAGCGGGPEGLLVPAGEAARGGSRVDLLVATTRSSDGALEGEMFTGERGQGLAFADISISIPPDSARKVGEVQSPETAPGNPETEFVTLKAERLDRSETLRRFHARVSATPGRRVLVFVHGYNTRFDDAVYRFAQIVHDSGAPATPVLFTWPSRGKLLAYTYDRESANYSRDALESVLQALSRDPAVGEIAILAHSMGNWVTLEALRQMAIRDKTLPRKLRNVMLAAPDVDFDVFRRQIESIESKGYHPPFTLFVSRDDGALKVSSRLWGGAARLGSIDPEQEPYKAELSRAGLQVVDLTRVESADWVGHAKFAASPEIVRMIGRRLASGQALSDGKSSVGEKVSGLVTGAAGVVGSAAGLAISAPLAVVDRRTRRSLGDRVDDIADNAEAMIGAPAGAKTSR